MSYRPVTYKKFSRSYEMLKQLLPSVLLKTEGFTNQYYKEKQDGVYKWLCMHKTKPLTCTMKVANSGTPYHG